MPKLVMQPSFRAVGQTHAEWQTFEKLENKRQNVWQSGMHGQTDYHTFVSRKCYDPRAYTWDSGTATNDLLFNNKDWPHSSLERQTLSSQKGDTLDEKHHKNDQEDIPNSQELFHGLVHRYCWLLAAALRRLRLVRHLDLQQEQSWALVSNPLPIDEHQAHATERPVICHVNHVVTSHDLPLSVPKCGV